MNEQEVALVAACDAVNADAALNELTEEWQAVNDPIEELRDESATTGCRGLQAPETHLYR